MSFVTTTLLDNKHDNVPKLTGCACVLLMVQLLKGSPRIGRGSVVLEREVSASHICHAVVLGLLFPVRVLLEVFGCCPFATARVFQSAQMTYSYFPDDLSLHHDSDANVILFKDSAVPPQREPIRIYVSPREAPRLRPIVPPDGTISTAASVTVDDASLNPSNSCTDIIDTVVISSSAMPDPAAPIQPAIIPSRAGLFHGNPSPALASPSHQPPAPSPTTPRDLRTLGTASSLGLLMHCTPRPTPRLSVDSAQPPKGAALPPCRWV